MESLEQLLKVTVSSLLRVSFRLLSMTECPTFLLEKLVMFAPSKILLMMGFSLDCRGASRNISAPLRLTILDKQTGLGRLGFANLNQVPRSTFGTAHITGALSGNHIAGYIHASLKAHYFGCYACVSASSCGTDIARMETWRKQGRSCRAEDPINLENETPSRGAGRFLEEINSTRNVIAIASPSDIIHCTTIKSLCFVRYVEAIISVWSSHQGCHSLLASSKVSKPNVRPSGT